MGEWGAPQREPPWPPLYTRPEYLFDSGGKRSDSIEFFRISYLILFGSFSMADNDWWKEAVVYQVSFDMILLKKVRKLTTYVDLSFVFQRYQQ